MKREGAEEKAKYIVYIDNGGTFTDCVIVKQDGSMATGKDYTSPSRLENCFFGSIKDAASKIGKTVTEVLSAAEVVGYGTTLGTNIIVSQGKGPRIGAVTTKGHEDRTVVMRSRAAGLTRPEGMKIVTADKVAPLVPYQLIRGVRERIDCFGEVIIRLDEQELRRAVKELLDQQIEGISVLFLWSFLNDVHEKRAREIIHEMAPGLPVAISSEVAPVMREYPRFMSSLIELYIGPPLNNLLKGIGSRLKESGYAHPLLVMQAAGGLANADVVRPSTTLHSGPVGGLTGVDFMKTLYGYSQGMGSDVGGTSFDVSISPAGKVSFVRVPEVGRFEIATPMRELHTIGAGGGTVAWVDPVTKTLNVGPQSAGSDPGPVCFDTGGTEPTVTDANVVLNRIDPNFFLGGRRRLNRDKAMAVIKEKIADPLNLDIYQAAEGIINILDGTMKACMETVMGTKGIDPARTILFAFGGAGPLHCARYQEGLGFGKVIIPSCAAEFSAFGASTADIQHRYEGSPFAFFSNIPYDSVTLKFLTDQITTLDQVRADMIEKFNNTFATLDARANKELAAEGFNPEQAERRYEMLARYGGQLWELSASIPITRINTVGDFRTLVKAFEEAYLQEYTEEAMVPRSGIEVITLAVTVVVKVFKPSFVKKEYVGKDPSPGLKGERDVYLGGRFMKTKIYDMTKLGPGNIMQGPAIIESWDTTVLIPPGFEIGVDEYLNLDLRGTN